MRDVRDRPEIRHVVLGIAQALEVDAARILVDQLVNLFGLVRIEEADLDPQLLERLGEKGPGPAVEARRRDEILTGVADREERARDRRLPRGEAECGRAAVHRGEPLLEHVVRRISQPTVDVAELREPEEVRGMLRVVEHIRRRRVDRDGARLGDGIGLLAGVDGHRSEAGVRRFVAHEGPPWARGDSLRREWPGFAL